MAGRARRLAARLARVPSDRFPPGFGAGVRLFNAGEFFAAHEAFEDLLELAEGDDWECLVGLIQVAVGYHKCVSGHPGAARMLALGAAKLARFPSVFRRLAVGRLRHRVGEDLAILEAGGRLSGPPPRIEMLREPPRSAE